MSEELGCILSRLSRDQRNALARPQWSMMAQYRAGIAELVRLGLLDTDAFGHKLSALGQQARQALTGASPND